MERVPSPKRVTSGTLVSSMAQEINKKDTEQRENRRRATQQSGWRGPEDEDRRQSWRSSKRSTHRDTSVNFGVAAAHADAIRKKGSVAPIALPLLTDSACDVLLNEMEASLQKLDNSTGNAVKLIKAELEMLTLFERLILLMDGALRSSGTEVLVGIFGDGTRLARARAVADSVEFSDANKKDRRINDLIKKCQAVETASWIDTHNPVASQRTMARQKAVLAQQRHAAARFRTASWIIQWLYTGADKDGENTDEKQDTNDKETSKITLSHNLGEDTMKPRTSRKKGKEVKDGGGDDPFLVHTDGEDSDSSDGSSVWEAAGHGELGIDVQAAAPENLMLLAPMKSLVSNEDENLWSRYFDLIFVSSTGEYS